LAARLADDDPAARRPFVVDDRCRTQGRHRRGGSPDKRCFKDDPVNDGSRSSNRARRIAT
jgi:hypothetical protein